MPSSSDTLDLLIVGAGFAGLYMLHKARSQGLKALVLEAEPSIGGVWFRNRYPGARCDVESLQYSYSFDPEIEKSWEWSEHYATQPEILRYIHHVADRLDLRRDIRLNTRVAKMQFQPQAGEWRVETEAGEVLTARFCVMATGALSAAKTPDIPGVEDFAGRKMLTSNWPAEGVDLAGRRVGVIGTGSTGIQAIPEIAKQAKHLTVFQRTPSFSVPARNQPVPAERRAFWEQNREVLRAKARTMRSGTLHQMGTVSALSVSEVERNTEFERRWQFGGPGFLRAYIDIGTDIRANDLAADFVRAKIREAVNDPKLAELLTPRDYPIGTKRICVDSEYYQTYNRPNVSLVDLKANPIDRIVPAGVRLRDGTVEALDDLVFATGFDALTGALNRIEIKGGDGTVLRDKWMAGPRTYLGVLTAGIENFFMITGPGSPSVLSNMIVSIEQHVDWIAGLIGHMRDTGKRIVTAKQTDEDAWVEEVNAAADRTLHKRAASWYLGANVPGKPRVFMPYSGGVGVYRERCDAIAAAGYPGLAFQS
jgi:cyclohexanone monooxygenase